MAAVGNPAPHGIVRLMHRWRGCDVSTAKGFANFAERVALSWAHAMTRITTGEGPTLGPPIGVAECIFTLGALDQLRQYVDVRDRCEAGAARWD
jgi:hypothetical protein